MGLFFRFFSVFFSVTSRGFTRLVGTRSEWADPLRPRCHEILVRLSLYKCGYRHPVPVRCRGVAKKWLTFFLGLLSPVFPLRTTDDDLKDLCHSSCLLCHTHTHTQTRTHTWELVGKRLPFVCGADKTHPFYLYAHIGVSMEAEFLFCFLFFCYLAQNISPRSAAVAIFGPRVASRQSRRDGPTDRVLFHLLSSSPSPRTMKYLLTDSSRFSALRFPRAHFAAPHTFTTAA